MLSFVDYASCKKHGISYRALPSTFEQPVCTGRNLPGNELCNEVSISLLITSISSLFYCCCSSFLLLVFVLVVRNVLGESKAHDV